MPRLEVVAALAMDFVRDDRGQDLVEYALLTGLISAGSLLMFSQLASAMGDAYDGWNTAAQNAWEPCPPAGSGLPCS